LKLNEDLAYLVGALRDGSVYYYAKNRSYYTIFYQKNIQWLKNSIGERIKKLFGINFRIDEYKTGQYRLRISNKHLYELWKTVFLFPKETTTQVNWNIPEKIIKSKKKEKTAYIRGFFDAEGDVSPTNSTTKYIGLSQKNIVALTKLRELIEELGLKCSKIYLADKRSNTFRVTIIGKQQIHKFYRVVGVEHPVKLKKIEEIIFNEIEKGSNLSTIKKDK